MPESNNSHITSNIHLDWIDVSKGIGIILVVFAHINYTPFILQTIYSFHMPLFFIISGILFNRSKYASYHHFLLRKLKTLICPYILFYSLVLIYTYVSEILDNGPSYFNLTSLVQDFLQMLLSQGSSKVISPPLWFVLCLFAVENIYFFIAKMAKKWIIVTTSALFVVIGWIFETFIIQKYGILLPWSIDSAFFALGFFAIGNLLSSQINQTIHTFSTNKSAKLSALAISIVGFVATSMLAMSNGHVSLGSKMLNNGFIFYLTGIIGSISIFGLAVILQNSKFLVYCGRNSFCIMSTHYVIRKTYRYFASRISFLHYDETILTQTILPFILILLASLFVAAIYNSFKRIAKIQSAEVTKKSQDFS